MYDFILQLFFLGSLSVIVYMMARVLPRVVQESQRPGVFGAVDRLLARLPLQKLDDRLGERWGKWLRQTRLVVTKFDNYLLHKINSRKNGTDNGSSIKELLEKVNEERQ